MTGLIPDDGIPAPPYSPEFEAVFWDEFPCVLPGEGHFNNHYFLTNCGTMPSVPDGAFCLANVWTASYDRMDDWADQQFCRGAWDTRLFHPEVPDPPGDRLAWDNRQALFPDGRYAFRVLAESQGSRMVVEDTLPVNSIAIPPKRSVTRGVVVDNYAPIVDSVIVYVTPDFEIIYEGGWSLPVWDGTAHFRSLHGKGMGYLEVLQSTIGVAVRYSEPVLQTAANDVRLSLVCGSDTLWTSLADRSDWFTPDACWNTLLGDTLPDSLGCWQCYPMSAPLAEGSFPAGYRGRFVLGIGGVAQPFPGQNRPLDLAMNPLDSDPATVAARDADTGNWPANTYETGLDGSHTWAVARNYCRVKEDEAARGSVCGEAVVVPLEEQVWEATLQEDCPWICGFWMGRQSSEEDFIREYAVRPNGYQRGMVDDHDIPTLFSNIGCPGYEPGAGSYLGRAKPVAGERYLWLTVQNEVVLPESLWSGECIGSVIGHVVCVDPEDGVLLDYEVFDGGRFMAPIHVWHGSRFTSLRPLDEGPDSVKVYFSMAGPYPVLKPDSMVVSLDAGLTRQPSLAAAFLAPALPAQAAGLHITANPCRGQLSLSITCRSAASVPVQLFDLAGRVMLEQQVTLTPGENRLSLPTEGLPSGVYQLRVELPGETLLRTVVLLD